MPSRTNSSKFWSKTYLALMLVGSCSWHTELCVLSLDLCSHTTQCPEVRLLWLKNAEGTTPQLTWTRVPSFCRRGTCRNCRGPRPPDLCPCAERSLNTGKKWVSQIINWEAFDTLTVQKLPLISGCDLREKKQAIIFAQLLFKEQTKKPFSEFKRKLRREF